VSRDDMVVAAGGKTVSDTVQPGTYVVSATAGTYEAAEVSFDIVNGPPVEHVVTLAKKKNVKIVVSRDRIELKDTVNFETGKAVIKSESFGLLDQAVQILVDYPEIQKLRIEGHTDSRGSASYNLKLSKERAASVMAYFIEKGVDPERLHSEGYGEDRPLDPAKTAEAYAKNRRVDFFIEEWDETKGQKTIEVAPE
jgi:outer membrane protein OmpA-like peptidoglycan-associated protein